MKTDPVQLSQAELADDLAYAERRTYQRHRVHIEACLHVGGEIQKTIINDISAGGVGLARAIGLSANDEIEIEFEGGRRIASKVVWKVSGSCGVQFAEPLAADDPLLPAAGLSSVA